MSSNPQQERLPSAETWAIVLRAVRQCLAQIKRNYGVEAQSIELIEQPRRTLVIRDVRPVVQASISLAGDTIDITAPRLTVGGLVNESESIQIEFQNGTTSYIHDGEQFSDPMEVAKIILDPVLDRYRMAS